jgi:hypothetical protein
LLELLERQRLPQREPIDEGWHRQNLQVDSQLRELRGACVALPKPKLIREHRFE